MFEFNALYWMKFVRTIHINIDTIKRLPPRTTHKHPIRTYRGIILHKNPTTEPRIEHGTF